MPAPITAPVLLAVLPLSTGVPLFVGGAIASLGASTVLVRRIERLGGCLELSHAAIGLLAALCADAPEITSSVTAFAHHDATVGVTVVFGSNVFNIAALLGLGALAAGAVTLHRRAALLEGAVGSWVAVLGVLVDLHALPDAAGLGLTCAVLVPYAVLTVVRRKTLRRLGVPARAASWLGLAIREEGVDLAPALPRRAGGQRAAPHAAVAAVALAMVVAASIAMEKGATQLGTHAHWPAAVTGGIVLAAVTSLPNAVTGIYLAARGRGAAVMSETMNSNTLNVLAGLLIPGVLVPLPTESSATGLTALWYAALTALVVLLVIGRGGLTRRSGVVVVVLYLCFVGALVAS